MKQQRKFIASIIATAKAESPRLPFERGAPRAAMIARRQAALEAALGAQAQPQSLPRAKRA